MKVPLNVGAFVRPPYEAAGLRIEVLPSAAAARLGAAFGAVDPWVRYPYQAAALTAYFAAEEPAAPRFALRRANELVGVIGLRLNWLRGPYVQFFGILPEYQRCGLGAEALSWVEREARGAGERNLWIAASDFNEPAPRFYQARGFVQVAALADLVRDGRTEILLRKRL